jgi:hypothetical protein
MKIQELITSAKTNRLFWIGVLVIPVVLGIAIPASMNAKAGAKLHTPDKASKVISADNGIQSNSEIKREQAPAMSEWSAFSIYHPYSQINEEILFQTFKKKKELQTEVGETAIPGSENTKVSFLLSGQALVPILRATFGDQIRTGNDIERDPWFTTHPSALFTPEQMKALCSNDLAEVGEGNFEICWRPKLTDQYLSALTDFATDACPQLVNKEFRSNNLHLNKLVRSRDFREQNLKIFASAFLKIPSEKVSESWLTEITTQARDALRANLEETQKEASEEQKPEAIAPDLYALSCQAMILSREFYSR